VCHLWQMRLCPAPEAAQLVAAGDGKGDGIFESHRDGLMRTCANTTREGVAGRSGCFGDWFEDPGAALAVTAGSNTRQSACLAKTVYEQTCGDKNCVHTAIMAILPALSNRPENPANRVAATPQTGRRYW